MIDPMQDADYSDQVITGLIAELGDEFLRMPEEDQLALIRMVEDELLDTNHIDPSVPPVLLL